MLAEAESVTVQDPWDESVMIETDLECILNQLNPIKTYI